MRVIKGVFSLLWRSWFLLTYAVPFVLLMPITIFFTLSQKFYPVLYWILHRLAWFILYASGIFPKIKREGSLDSNKQYIFCSNHPSTLDIVLMFALSKKPISFIGKASLGKIPVFGYYYKSFNVLVDRSKLRNSYVAYQKAGEKLKDGQNMVIYPEGGIPKEDIRLFRFKNGPFRLALEEQVSIIPITFADNKRLFPMDYLRGKPGIARITIHEEMSTKGMNEKNIEELKTQVFNIIESELIRYENESR
ncbi:MAG: 1-acyl-sn-glycerol-3-phosphate acyltransferase [Flavobacteriales bacterium]|nr:1-acyl-sn-glycerol-3-phosphate acyltransferase [Flavobacteriales bacterium]|tara:strand:+ start:760 stop:1506 length:747 start_codon:yes stop_codon:yes gene_type:complete